jgi:spermidine synthase
MGVELSSSLIIKPFFGTSLDVWTSILVVTSFSLASGYFIGSLILKLNKERFLVYLYFILIFSILSIPFIAKSAFRSSIQFDLVPMTFITIASFLTIPLTIIGVISTLLIKQLEIINAHDNELVSRTYSISSIGGVVSLVFLSMFLLRYFDSYSIILILSFLAIFSVVLISIFLIKVKWLLPMFLAVFIFVAFYISNGRSKIQDVFPKHVKVLYEKEGVLGHILVLKDFTTKTKILMVNNSIQTTTDFENNGNYTHIQIITNFLKTERASNKEILVAGLGGGSIVKELMESQKNIDVVEIDENMIDVCNEHFGLTKSKKVKFIIDDARHYVNSSLKKYDYIIFDLSLGETIPSNVYTYESFKKCTKLLKPNGKIIINFFSNHSKNGLKSIEAIGASLQANSFQVSLNKTEFDTLGNVPFVFVSSFNKILDTNFTLRKFDSKLILNDKNSKLDVYHKAIVNNQRLNYIKFYKEYFKQMNEASL